MIDPRKARDLRLLDDIESRPRVKFSGTVWRICKANRDPLAGHAGGARWDPGNFDVIYTSLEREGALTEIHYHLTQQPVFPSKLVHHIHEIQANTEETLELADLSDLKSLGVQIEEFHSHNYARTQEISDAAYFVGFDGIIVPSARGPFKNLVLFTDKLSPVSLEVLSSAPVDWNKWLSSR